MDITVKNAAITVGTVTGFVLLSGAGMGGGDGGVEPIRRICSINIKRDQVPPRSNRPVINIQDRRFIIYAKYN